MRLSIALILLVSWLSCGAITRYSAAYNHFASLRPASADGCSSRVEGDRWVTDNGSALMALIADTMSLPADAFRVQLRAANKHNSPRSSYTVHDGEGRRQRIRSTQWGLFFGSTAADGVRWTLTAQCSNSNIDDDVTDTRSMTIALKRWIGDEVDNVLAERTISSGVDLYDGLNTLQVEMRDGVVTAWVGNIELQQLFEVPITTDAPMLTAGCCVGPGARVEVERLVIACDTQSTPTASHEWTLAELDDHFAQSDDPVEGYWRYQDRDLEDRYLRLGGRYTVAVVREGDAYEIIYLDGAETHRSQWHAGMLKGRFTRTIFSDHYDLMWIDATGEPIVRDAYVTVDNGVLMTLKFPVYNSQMRLSKVLLP